MPECLLGRQTGVTAIIDPPGRWSAFHTAAHTALGGSPAASASETVAAA